MASTWIIHVLSVLALLAAAISAIEKRRENKRASNERRKDYDTEIAVTTLSIFLIIVNIQLDTIAKHVDDTVSEMISGPNAVGIIVSTAPRAPDILRLMEEQIETAWGYRSEASAFSLWRAEFNKPIPLGQDPVLRDRWQAMAFPLIYILGFPNSGESAEEKANRRQMESATFVFLTDPGWQGVPPKLRDDVAEILYVPSVRRMNTWVVDGGGGNHAAAVIFEGDWRGEAGAPTASKLVDLGDEAAAALATDDLRSLRERGLEYARTQMALQSFERDPITVFLSGDDDYSLKPLPFDSVLTLYRARQESWNASGLGNERPPQLQRLEEIITEMSVSSRGAGQ